MKFVVLPAKLNPTTNRKAVKKADFQESGDGSNRWVIPGASKTIATDNNNTSRLANAGVPYGNRRIFWAGILYIPVTPLNHVGTAMADGSNIVVIIRLASAISGARK